MMSNRLPLCRRSLSLAFLERPWKKKRKGGCNYPFGQTRVTLWNRIKKQKTKQKQKQKQTNKQKNKGQGTNDIQTFTHTQQKNSHNTHPQHCTQTTRNSPHKSEMYKW